MIKFVDIPMQLHYDGVRWLILGDDNGICGCPCAGAWLVVLLSFIFYILSFVFYLLSLYFILSEFWQEEKLRMSFLFLF